VRIGKTALWIPYHSLEDWRAFLIDVLERLKLESVDPIRIERSNEPVA
jgi:hypothetical protein